MVKGVYKRGLKKVFIKGVYKLNFLSCGESFINGIFKSSLHMSFILPKKEISTF